MTGNSRLVVIHPANAGTLFTIDRNANGLGLAVDSQNIGFDITGTSNRAPATLSVAGVFGLYRIDLDLELAAGGTGTGDAALAGNFGVPAGTSIRGFAMVIPPPPPPPEPPAPTPTPPASTTVFDPTPASRTWWILSTRARSR